MVSEACRIAVNARLLTRLAHGIRKVGQRQRGVMGNGPLLRRKKIGQISLPRRILARPKAMCLRPIEDGFDPTANSLRRFRLGSPDRLEDRNHQGSIDRTDGHLGELGKGASLQGRRPLLCVLRAPLSSLTVGDVEFSAPSECHGVRVRTLDNWVAPRRAQSTRLCRQFASPGE